MNINIEPDPAPRNTPYHKKIVEVKPVPNTHTGHYVRLECGHWAMTFGSLDHANGVVLCMDCRDAAGVRGS